jgi:hypothetical protein
MEDLNVLSKGTPGLEKRRRGKNTERIRLLNTIKD